MADRPGLRLRTARLSQHRESDGEPWSQDNLLDAIAATGWRPAYKNYLDTERGEVIPKPETWKRYAAFWAKRGIDLEAIELPEPDREPESAPDLATALVALAKSNESMVQELAAWRTERQALLAKVEDLGSQVAELLEDRDARESAAPTAPDVPPASTGSGR